jgi:hypothetical protein
MVTHTFTRQNDTWYVNKQETGTESGQAMCDGAASILNLLSSGDKSVTVTFGNEYFENAETLWLLQTTQPFLDGGLYFMGKCNGTVVDTKLWLCDLVKLVYGTVPEVLFVRKELAAS